MLLQACMANNVRQVRYSILQQMNARMLSEGEEFHLQCVFLLTASGNDLLFVSIAEWTFIIIH